ncbi:DUF6807 family protein [Streptomyces griseus]|uniref:DUF6807 family protein n=1 Tax=Streptomyces griseus TaxID=1911 RepID=UPI00373AF59F
MTWFARSSAFACLNPSPAFHSEIKLEPGGILSLSHRFVFVDRVVGRRELEPLCGSSRCDPPARLSRSRGAQPARGVPVVHGGRRTRRIAPHAPRLLGVLRRRQWLRSAGDPQ